MSERVPAQTKNSAKPSMAAQQSSSLFEQRPFTDERYEPIAKDSTISTDSPTIGPKNARPRLNLLEIMLQQSSGKTANQTGAIQRQPTEEANEEESTNLQMQPEGSIQLKCSKCEQEEKEKNLYLKSETLQRQAEDNHDWEPSPAASALQRRANSAFIPKPQVNLKTNGAGSSLSKPVQQKMSAAFGANFSDVRIHEGAQAKSINALAYTQGNHIHFAPGKYNPTSEDGQKLLGHELTHVVQQRAGRVPIPQGKGTPINADPALEAEADDLGAKAAQGKSVTVAGASSGVQQKSAQTIPIQRFKLFSKIANTVKNKASSAVNAVKSGVNTVKNTAQSGVKAVTNKVSSGVSAVKNKVSSGVNTVKRGFSKAKNKVSSGVNRVKRGFNTVKNTVKNKVSRGVNRVKRGINTVKNQAKRAYNTVKKKVASNFKAVKRGVNLVKNQAKRAYNATKNQVKRGFNAVKNKVGGNLNIAKRGFNAVKNGIKGNFNAVKNKVSSGFNTAKQTFNAAKNGVKSAYNTVKNKVSSGFNTVKEGLKNVNWRDVGHAALDVAGFIPVVGAVADVANAAWYLAEGDYTNAALSGISAIPGIGDAIGGVAKGGKAAFKLGKAGNMLGKANKLLPNAGKLVGKAGGLANKVSSSAGKLVGKVGDLANKVPPGVKSKINKVMNAADMVGTGVDVASTAHYLAQGDYGNALVSGISAIPGVGKGGKGLFNRAKGSKLFNKAGKGIGKVKGFANKVPSGIKSLVGKGKGGLSAAKNKLNRGVSSLGDKLRRGKGKPNAGTAVPNKVSGTKTPGAKPKRDLPMTTKEQNVLNNTASKRGDELTPKELNAERKPKPRPESPTSAPRPQNLNNPAKLELEAPGTPKSTRYPHNQKVDTPATVSTKVGEIEHEVMPRQVGDKMEIWVCSNACDNVTAKIDDMLAQLPDNPAHQKLREDLLALKQEVEALKPRLETGKNRDGEFWEHSEMSEVTGQIAKKFQELGQQHPVVGRALNEPSQIANVLTTGSQTRTFNPSETVTIMQEQGLDPQTRLVYTIRDKQTGAVLKPGETVVENSDERFRRYERAARGTNLEIEIEVAPIPQAQNRSQAKGIEYRLRDDLEGQGNIMHWDNENNRLGRQGPGTPFEPLPGTKSSRLRQEGYTWNDKGHLTNETGEAANIPRKNAAMTKEDLRKLMIKHQGNQRAIAEELGMNYEALKSQMKRAGLSSRNFRN